MRSTSFPLPLHFPLLAACLALARTIDAAPSWGSIGNNDCVAPGIRNVFARLNGAGKDWNADCAAIPITINGQTFSGSETKCIDKKILGEWGQWNVYDSTCAPYWGSFQQDSCTSDGHRQYSSVLWGIPDGTSWEDWCNVWPADIQGSNGLTQHFYKPDRCVNVGPGINIWGQFDLSDTSCCGFSGSDTAEHNELKKRRVSRRLLQPSDPAAEHADTSRQLNNSSSVGHYKDSAKLSNETDVGAHEESAKLSHETDVGQHQGPAKLSQGVDVGVHEAPGRQLQAGNGCPAAAGPANGVDWLTFLATAAGVARAISQSSLVGMGPSFNNVNPFNDPSVLYQVQDGNGNQGWQVRDANFPTGAPTNQVPGSTPTNLNALWVPILAPGTDQASFIRNYNGNGVLDIPAASFTRMDNFNAPLMMTTYLTGCAFVWAYDAQNDVLYFAHIQPDPGAAFAPFRAGTDLANWLSSNPVRFHGVNAPVQVFGRTADQGYLNADGSATTGNMFAVRHSDGTISVVGQVLDARPTQAPSVRRFMQWILRRN